MASRVRSLGTASLGIAVIVIAAACSSSGGGGGGPTTSSTPTSQVSSPAPISSSQPKHGGSITVLESKGYAGDWATGLDPASDTSAIPNQDMMEAIYGQLFILGPGGVQQPDLATSASFSADTKTVTIQLRQGVTFSDGTPFNAAAVIYNWNRDFGPLAV